MHIDVRSDNLRLNNGRLRLFDWPFASIGAPEMDVAIFSQTVSAEGGPEPEEIVKAYASAGHLDADLLTGAVASITGFLGLQIVQPDIPGLPRIRPFQRNQFVTSLDWVARRLDIETPT